MLYHATYKQNLYSILELGLLPNSRRKVWSDCDSGVYLSENIDQSYSFAEVGIYESDNNYSETDIIIIAIDELSLNKNKLFNDNFNRDEEYGTFVYMGKIEVDEAMVINAGVINSYNDTLSI